MWAYGNVLNGSELLRLGMWVILIIAAIYVIRRLRPLISTASTHSNTLKKAHRETEPEEIKQTKET